LAELPLAALEEWLAAAGYEVRYRHDAWYECLVSGRGESWCGAGATRQSALCDALSKAFPSAASRVALSRALGPVSDVTVAEQPVAGGGDATDEWMPPASSETPAAEESCRESAAESAVTETSSVAVETGAAASPVFAGSEASVDDAAPADAETVPLHDDDVGEEIDGAVDVASATAEKAPSAPVDAEPTMKPQEVPATPARVLPSPRLRPDTAPETAIAELRMLQELIAGSEEELALLTPERQRLQMQVWVCEARSYQEIHLGDEKVYDAVSRVVKQLTGMAKAFWPGSITSMREHVGPEVVVSDHRLKAPPPHSWLEARERVEEAGESAAAADDANGRDEFGWPDAPALLPPPNRPECLLQEIRSRIVKLTGPLEGKPDFEAAKLPKRPSTKLVGEFVELGRKVRWLRLAVPDQDLLWGRLCGRLRAVNAWWRAKQNGPLLAVLSPDFAPKKSWAAELGIDPERRQRQRRRWNLFQRFQSANALAVDEMAGLLGGSFDLFNNIELAALLAPAVSTIQSIGGEALEKRPWRRRLGALKKRLQEGSPESREEREALEAIKREGPAGGPDESLDVAETADPVAMLVEQLRARTAGKRALLISNRKDDTLAEQLRSRLGFSEVDVAVSDPRRLSSASEAISGGAFTFVLAVSGFMGHSADGAVADACRRSGTLLVRIGKGRPLAAIRALGRVLRVSPAADPTATDSAV
jgi:hypothetical protein